MEFLNLLPVGLAVAAIALRAYLSAKEARVANAEEMPLSGRPVGAPRRVYRSTLARKLLQYHRGLARA